MKGGWKKLENEDRNDLYCSIYSVDEVKDSEVEWLWWRIVAGGGGCRIEMHADFGGETWREEASWRSYRVIQKSEYVGKMVCLFMNRALYVCRCVDSVCGCVCPTLGELALTYVVLCAHTQL
jgi:hypothetical protein